jgi:RES domain-containing protein
MWRVLLPGSATSSDSSLPNRSDERTVFSKTNVTRKTHPKFDEIKRELQKFSNKGTSFSAICYRCTEPQFADQIVSGLGSQIHGARWTPKNSFPAVYLCDTVESALQEYLARARRMKLPDHKSLPMVMAWVRVKAVNLIDITDPEIAATIKPFLEAEKIHWRSIQERREAISQAIGRAIKEMSFSGLIAASQASPGNKNIVIFPQNLRSNEALSAPSLKPVA